MQAQLEREKVAGTTPVELVKEYLEKQGYEILASRFRCRIGMLDVIAKKDGVLTFVVIKSKFIRTPRDMTFDEQQHYRRVATYYMLVNDMLQEMPITSFDVAMVIIRGDRIMFKYFPRYF